MLLKLLFTMLAVLWLIQALRPYFRVSQGTERQRQAPPPPGSTIQKREDKDEDEYIDYEEIK